MNSLVIKATEQNFLAMNTLWYNTIIEFIDSPIKFPTVKVIHNVVQLIMTNYITFHLTMFYAVCEDCHQAYRGPMRKEWARNLLI